jgi:hypothetical protein
MSIAPPKLISKWVASAPLIIAICAIISTIYASIKPVDNSALHNDIKIISQQVASISLTTAELQRTVAIMQVNQSRELSLLRADVEIIRSYQQKRVKK